MIKTLPVESADRGTLEKTEDKPSSPRKYPIAVISDIHLGMRNLSNDKLDKFLRELDCETLILNGDIIDGLRISGRSDKNKLSKDDLLIIDALNDLIARGTKVVYVPGNHDEALRSLDLYGKTVMGITFAEYYVHKTPEGKSFFISHGDQFDQPLQHTTHVSPKLFKIGDVIYGTAAQADLMLNKVSQTVLKKEFDVYGKVRSSAYHQLIQASGLFIKNSSGKRLTPKQLMQNLKYVGKSLKTPSTAESDFRDAAVDRARKGGFDGIVCGHTHMPELSKTPDGIIYANSGDWIRHFSALVMNNAGEWEILNNKDDSIKVDLGKKKNAADKNTVPSPATQEVVKAVRRTWPGNKKSGGIYSGYKGA